MLKMELRGKLFTVIKNIYESAKSCVAARGEMLEFVLLVTLVYTTGRKPIPTFICHISE